MTSWAHWTDQLFRESERGTMKVEETFYVDGHCIGAADAKGAREACHTLYGYDPEVVRLWTEDDEC